MLPEEFIGHFRIWASKNASVICNNFNQKGGWEGWTQVELMNYINKLGLTVVQREIPIYYNVKHAADLIVNFQDAQVNKQICIELKCESVFQSAYDGRQKLHNRIQDKVSADILRLTTQRRDDYQTAFALMLAIGISPEAYKALSAPHLEMVIEIINLNEQDQLFIAYKLIK